MAVMTSPPTFNPMSNNCSLGLSWLIAIALVLSSDGFPLSTPKQTHHATFLSNPISLGDSRSEGCLPEESNKEYGLGVDVDTAILAFFQ